MTSVKLYNLLYKPKPATLREQLDQLLEARIDDAKMAYPDVADELDQFRTVPQKYIMWIAKELDNGKKTLGGIQDPEYMKTIVLNFDKAVTLKAISPTDINAYHSFDELDVAVSEVDLTSKTKKREDAKKGSELIYKDAKFVIIKPLTTEASCYYGNNTKWCISAKEENRFKHYTDQGVTFYFVIDKKPENQNYYKIAFAVYENGAIEIYDAADNTVNPEKISDIYPRHILDIINKVTDSNFLKIEDIVSDIVSTLSNTDTTTSEFLKALQNLYDTYASTDERDYDDEGDSKYTVIIRKIISELPLNKVPLLYHPDGYIDGISLKNIGTYWDFVQRLISENVTASQLLEMIKISWEIYKPTRDSWFYSDPYTQYIEHKTFSIEEIKLIASFKPKNMDYPPYIPALRDNYLQSVLEKINIESEEVKNIVRIYLVNSTYREPIEMIASGISTNNNSLISKGMDFIWDRGFPFEKEDLLVVGNLFNKGILKKIQLDPTFKELS